MQNLAFYHLLFSFSLRDLYAFLSNEPNSDADFSAMPDTEDINEDVESAGE